ncbi:MAG: SRPBCC domain-containing protein [Ignavibacteria bacterium]
MTEKNFSKEKFTHGIYLNAPAERVFEIIATPSGITKWFIGKAKYYYKDMNIRLGNEVIQKGDSYLWTWLNKDLELKGIITAVDENKIFQFTFSPLYIVTIKINSEGNKTMLTLKQEYQESAVMDEFNFINCCTCWVFFLTNLKSVIEHGIDLREAEADDEMLVNR